MTVLWLLFRSPFPVQLRSGSIAGDGGEKLLLETVHAHYAHSIGVRLIVIWCDRCLSGSGHVSCHLTLVTHQTYTDRQKYRNCAVSYSLG